MNKAASLCPRNLFKNGLVAFILLLQYSAMSFGQTDTSHNKIDRKWWKEAVVYQIYPRSF